MAARPRNRILTRKDLDEDEYLIDKGWGRRYCPVHRTQQMIPLLPGLDTCPACQPAGASERQQPEPLSPDVD